MVRYIDALPAVSNRIVSSCNCHACDETLHASQIRTERHTKGQRRNTNKNRALRMKKLIPPPSRPPSSLSHRPPPYLTAPYSYLSGVREGVVHSGELALTRQHVFSGGHHHLRRAGTSARAPKVGWRVKIVDGRGTSKPSMHIINTKGSTQPNYSSGYV